ncbi:hypothetical protein DFH06DRAFT_1009275 [Mycena polygramma]|nr:hypothetical protein DFH06DRAFT_1009275 [Mycena polygramma]
MVISIEHPQLLFDPVLNFDQEGARTCLRLRGVIYGGHGHFTCRYFAADGTAWFHDGISTGRRCRSEGDLRDFGNLGTCANNRAVAVIYARV